MKDYIEQAKRTEPTTLSTEGNERLLHAGIGMATEAGEFLDALKKSMYGKEIDKTNLKEELGDILWYMATAMDDLGTDFETEMKRNVDKLRERYPEKFSLQQSDERDTQKEREILEKE